METWYPPKDRPQLLEWWRPLIQASRTARLQRVPWPIHVDEFVLGGRIDRPGRPAIWVFRHPEAGGELYLDTTGQPYKFTRTPRAKGFGRFTATDFRTAVWQAGLPGVVDSVWHEPPAIPGPSWDASDAAEAERAAVEAADAAPEPSAPRRRGHLAVYDGGRPLAG